MSANEQDIDSTPNNNVAAEDDQDDAVVTILPEGVPMADLELNKVSSASVIEQGESFSYTITLVNEGPDAATGVQVLENLPSGVSYVSHSSSLGTYNSNVGVWSITSLAAGASATLTIEVMATGEGSVANVAQVIASGEEDPDSTPNNNNPAEDDQDDAVVTITVPGEPMIDLELNKTASKLVMNVGETFTYTISVSNEGPDMATGVSVNELLPSGVSYVSHVSSTGTYVPSTATWTIGTMNAGSVASLTIEVMATGEGSVTNVAQVLSANEQDIDSTPNNNVGAEDDQDDAVVTILPKVFRWRT
ncbi:MAG: DUF11 domain-containing protein [Chitinophagales bacterium]